MGATYEGTDDQTPRFLKEGIWQNGYQDKHLDTVRSVQVGARIAIKSTYTKKHNLPFDSRGHTVSVMAIKAIGIVTENLGDGRTLKVDWQAFNEPREWYFYTYRGTVWRVEADNWHRQSLIDFAFNGKEQDINQFRNDPFWRERFGDVVVEDDLRFKWTVFYEEMADKLLAFRNRRGELIAGIRTISEKVNCLSVLHDRDQKNGTKRPMQDICPFTVLGIFNRGITDANRKVIASELAGFLGVATPVPDSFEGIPVLNNQRSWFFGYSYVRKPGDIEILWDVFAQAILYAETGDEQTRSDFVSAYDKATHSYGVGWNLTMGLYWIRPWYYLTLDAQSQEYITKKLNIPIGMNGPKGRCNAEDYLAVLETLENKFQEENYPVHSFPELSLAAWNFKDGASITPIDTDLDDLEYEMGTISEPEVENPYSASYALNDIVTDGSFIAKEKLEQILQRLHTKQNLILQGPPGTGKTWLAKRLAYALMGRRDDSKLRAVQFHPNLSYEDFIRGWRPSGKGELTLVDGPFMEMVEAAKRDPEAKYVIVIEEINRGNPAQIFGEMLTLLETDKRNPSEALELSYRRGEGERVYIPDNLYVIGTMNIADRSLALVDLALRRRFAFIDLEPTLGKLWHDWVNVQCGIDPLILNEIEQRMTALNDEISEDISLGPQFRVGHSYVTPRPNSLSDAKEWFRQVVETEIGPLLDEYWFDALDKSRKVKERLLEGF